jgi:hypothetical protein
MRPGDRVRVVDVLRDRYLNRMMLAGGAGMAVLSCIRQESLMPLRFHEHR